MTDIAGTSPVIDLIFYFSNICFGEGVGQSKALTGNTSDNDRQEREDDKRTLCIQSTYLSMVAMFKVAYMHLQLFCQHQATCDENGPEKVQKAFH